MNIENKSSLAKEVMDLEMGINHLIRFEILRAKIMRERYNALVDEGFTEDQAMELCKMSIIAK